MTIKSKQLIKKGNTDEITVSENTTMTDVSADDADDDSIIQDDVFKEEEQIINNLKFEEVKTPQKISEVRKPLSERKFINLINVNTNEGGLSDDDDEKGLYFVFPQFINTCFRKT